jgi:hypothetical protein
MFGFIKNILKNKCLKDAVNRAKKKDRIAHNFETAKTMGVIYPSNINMNAVLDVLKDIANRYNIKVEIIIYYSPNELPEIGQSDLPQIFFSDDKCNWFGKPVTADVNNFIKTNFNILIDLSTTALFPLQYIAATSHADFKIGRIKDETNDLYDFVLLGSKNEEWFIKDLETYLYKIK